jgi:cytochrome c oxidase assembly protein subunit 15
MTVLMQLPPAVSIGHALLAQSFLLMTVAIASATSRAWVTGGEAAAVPVDVRVRTLLAASVVMTFVQILLGAVVRHTYSAPAIPDFPLSNGALIPAFTDFHVVIHFAHRVGALITSVLIITGGVLVLRAGTMPRLRLPAIAMMLAVLVQVLLGATVIWTRQAILPNTLHVAFGALTFAAVFLSYLRAARWYHFRETRQASVLRVQEAGA